MAQGGLATCVIQESMSLKYELCGGGGHNAELHVVQAAQLQVYCIVF